MQSSHLTLFNKQCDREWVVRSERVDKVIWLVGPEILFASGELEFRGSSRIQANWNLRILRIIKVSYIKNESCHKVWNGSGIGLLGNVKFKVNITMCSLTY